jgi:hypothetical protein
MIRALLMPGVKWGGVKPFDTALWALKVHLVLHWLSLCCMYIWQYILVWCSNGAYPVYTLNIACCSASMGAASALLPMHCSLHQAKPHTPHAPSATNVTYDCYCVIYRVI